jgi:TPR repeat protein
MAFMLVVLFSTADAQSPLRNMAAERAQATELLARGDEAGFFRIMRDLSSAGDVAAQTMLGGILVHRREFAEAEMLLTRAAATGNPEAMWHLYGLNSLKSPPDYDAAEKWLRAAAQGGLEKAQDILDDAQVMPRANNGRFELDSIIEYARHISRRKINRFNAGQLACYRLSREDLLRESDVAFLSCQESALRAHGSSVALDQGANVMTEVAHCTNNAVFAIGGTNIKEMLLCLAALEPKT